MDGSRPGRGRAAIDGRGIASSANYRFLRLGAALAAVACAVTWAARDARALEITFRSFGDSAAIGPPADAYAAKLADLSSIALGKDGQVRFAKAVPTPAVPKDFKNILAAVAAGGPLAGGKGFDAAYISGSDLNPAWGFMYNSGVPFGPTFDEFIGFLYGKSVDGTTTGLDLLQELLDKRGRNVVAVPIVGSSEQGSGYFMKPVGDAGPTPGIGLAGLCQQSWTFRYLPPAQYVLDGACDALVADGSIPKKSIGFVAAVAGKGSLVKAVADNQIQAYEFATPLDDMSQLFGLPEGNPGTAGTRYLHFPGWHQQFLVTYMLINRRVWGMMSPAQQALVMSVGRDHVISSYGENLRQQGAKLREILSANANDPDPAHGMVLVQWPPADLARLRDATIRFLDARVSDGKLGEQDREDYARILEALRVYVSGNNGYWKIRDVPAAFRFQGWRGPDGRSWDQEPR